MALQAIARGVCRGVPDGTTTTLFFEEEEEGGVLPLRDESRRLFCINVAAEKWKCFATATPHWTDGMIGSAPPVLCC